MYNVIGHPAWLPAVKLDSCHSVLSSVHTSFIILPSVSLCIKRKHHYYKYYYYLFLYIYLFVSLFVYFLLSFFVSLFLYLCVSLSVASHGCDIYLRLIFMLHA